jgi:hypothetical protein
VSIEEDLKNRELWAEGFQARRGTPARIICDNFQGGDFRFVVAIQAPLTKEGWEFRTYNHRGEYYGGCPGERDLIRRPIKRKGWVNIYRSDCGPFGTCGGLETREQADALKQCDRIACIEIEFTEGEGLEVEP